MKKELSRRSGVRIAAELMKLLGGRLSAVMLLAVLNGSLGFLCAMGVPFFGAVGIATIMKLSRVLMLVFAAIVIAVWWDKNHSEMPADGKRKVSFPWFMLGFIGASIIGTFVPFIGAIAPNLVDFAYIVLGMAMAALGINVNFSAIAKKGQKAFLASFITSVLLMCFAAGVSALFF